MNTLYGDEIASGVKRTQVWQATHTGDGETRLPAMYRSFISFMWGGRLIEDFGLIAVTTNNAIERDIHAPFKNLTTELEVMDGQLFWGAHHQANSLSLTLHTDEITERQLRDFANWFKPGIERELILAEHPNRKIMARLEEPPRYSMLPFEKQIKTPWSNTETSTTIYRGSMTIKFTMDYPFWESINNFMEEQRYIIVKDQNTTRWATPFYPETMHKDNKMDPALVAKAEDWNKELRYLPEALKVIEEDGVPFKLMLDGNHFNFGSEYNINKIYDNPQIHPDPPPASDPSQTTHPQTNYPQYYEGAIFGGEYRIGKTKGQVLYGKGQKDDNEQDKLPQALYYYYAGNAPEKPVLEFTMNVSFDTKQLYIDEPANTYSRRQTTNEPYTTITLTPPSGEANASHFYFTTPSMLTAYNAAVKIFEEDIKKGTITDIAMLKQAVIENVHHYLIRDAIFTELNDETKIENIIPRGLLYALRRRFRYKPSTKVAANMLHELWLHMRDQDATPSPSTFCSGYDAGTATRMTFWRDVLRMVPPHLTYTGIEGADSLQNKIKELLQVDSKGNELLTESQDVLRSISDVIKECINWDKNNDSYINKLKELGSRWGNNEDPHGYQPEFNYSVNSMTGETSQTYGYRLTPRLYSYEYANDTGASDANPFPNITIYSESAGDIARSKYLKLEETCYPIGYDPTKPNITPASTAKFGLITPECCYKLEHNLVEGKLSNVRLLYRYKYY